MWTNDGYSGLAFGGLKVAFLKSFMQRNRVDFINHTSGAWITALALDGSAAAMVGLVACLDQTGSWQREGSEPQPAHAADQARANSSRRWSSRPGARCRGHAGFRWYRRCQPAIGASVIRIRGFES